MTTPAAAAAALRRSLAQNEDGFVMAEPERGLYLQLAKGAGSDTLLLTLRREAAFPTQLEIAKWVEAFGVPDGADNMRRHTWASTHPKTQRPLRWCACTFTWREIPAPVAALSTGARPD
jgi:hypothetical protein